MILRWQHGPAADESFSPNPAHHWPVLLFVGCAARGHHRAPGKEALQPSQALLRPQGMRCRLFQQSVVVDARARARDKCHLLIFIPSFRDGDLLLLL